jgi:hypothetical protein
VTCCDVNSLQTFRMFEVEFAAVARQGPTEVFSFSLAFFPSLAAAAAPQRNLSALERHISLTCRHSQERQMLISIIRSSPNPPFFPILFSLTPSHLQLPPLHPRIHS